MRKRINRRDFLRLSAGLAAGAALAGCATPEPQVLKETVEVEKEVTKIVEKEVTKVVEKLVTPEPIVVHTLGGPDETGWVASEYERFEALTGIKVEETTVPYWGHREKLLADFAAGGGAFDFYVIDCIEVAEYAAAGWALDVTDLITPEMKEDILPFAAEGMIYQSKWYGLPFISEWKSTVYNAKKFSDAGFDGLASTFDEFVAQCQAIQDAGLAKYGVSWSWFQGECLICDFAALAACFGGQFFTEQNEPLFHEGGAVDALQWMVDSIYKHEITDPASLTFTEGEVEEGMRAGEIAFSFQWGLPLVPLNNPEISKVVGECAIGLSPSYDGKHSACVSGPMGLSISAFSKYPREAWQLLNFRAGFEGAKRNAIGSGITPGWASLFTDPDVVEAVPGLDLMLEQAKTVVNRPRVPWYWDFSTALQEELHFALTQQKEPQQAMDDAYERTLEVKEEWEAG
ncbi:MAG: extracellular solute-binding protein [Anaerolineae bacterium]|nr:MAG: extracellular solute-binding protein [Anaerolineae bacterium]